MRTIVFTIAAVLFATLPLFAADAAPAAAPPQAAVPVKVVVLYSSGVGYFEHKGTVTGNASAELHFKSDQINDVLKSLVLQDLGGGTVSAVTYPSQNPLDKTLKSFEVDIASNPSLADLLTQLRGAKVTAVVQGQSVSGTVLGVEKRQVPSTDKATVTEPFLTVLTGAMIQVVPLADVRALSLDDPKLQAELEKALTALITSRDQDKKPVTIEFDGQGQRQVRLGYVCEVPVWKTSYRLLLKDRGAATQPTETATLQGWAIVENETDNDWDGVQLTLVSGRPISFIEDLYQSLYVKRPVVQPALLAGLMPQTYFGGSTITPPPGDVNAPAPTAAPAAEVPAANGGGMGGGGGGGENLLRYENSVAPQASGEQAGELFQYTLHNPVDLARQKSAMIPIIEDPVEIERVSIYNAAVLASHPLNGVWMKNSTGKSLLAGPVTVYDPAGYAGDASLGDVPQDQRRLLSYGVDLRVLVQSQQGNSQQQLVTGKIVKGSLELTNRNLAIQNYEIDNKGDEEKTIVVEHPITGGYDFSSAIDVKVSLVPADNTELDAKSLQPSEKTDTEYRFKFPVPANTVRVLRVTESQTTEQDIAILDANADDLIAFVHGGVLSDKVKDALTQAAAKKRAVIDTDAKIKEHDRRISEIASDQSRIDNTLRTISTNSDLYNRLMKKLSDEETELDTLHTEMTDLHTQRDAQQKDLEDYLAALNVD